ncbi:RagB/SusD family nutrient uptake outer membrane protein [Olivibacter sp. SDN3]|uniref:RagB/SusD family nutrient uptake outer membrane protein n=1 Tax=Olivibacter sp. SDN3 TaxID=2764720 RepID=UPI001651436E|nr:RagB/SusD family nutrient uptake outer membrane protein [Olivibacter sp. SDN3]QNL51440.1 RagB/SusD family nutrient uptake outer membrane protein [Olivibacter sp. SDN3]
MRKVINISSKLFFALIIMFSACKTDFLDTEPMTEVPQEVVWGDAGLAEAFVLEIYNGLGQGGLDEQMQASLTDESMFTHPGRGINTITESRTNPADQGWVNRTYLWDSLYTRIRASNIALKNLAEPQFENANNLVERLKGESHFLRAYYYQQLLRFYGGVPLIDRPYELGEEDYTAPRSSYEDCVNFIVADCDTAISLLNGLGASGGRAGDVAAMALKARVLLYAASDLHDVPTASSNSSTIGGYSNQELLGYVSGNRAERWQKAKDAALAVVNQMAHAYKMDLTEPVTPEEGTDNYVILSTGGGSRAISAEGAIDLLLARQFVDLKDEGGNYVGRNNGPNGYHNWAGNTPIQNLVDDYEMIDGTRFSWDNPTHSSAPYQNRDPRFYATVLHDGADWKPRTADVAGRDPFDQIQTGQYQVTTASGGTTTQYGLDTRNSPIEDWNGSYTGYYFRKFTDPDPAVVDQNTRQYIPWPVLRYTEAVLNYVEACIELGQDGEARNWLNKIRFRAGMPAVTESGDALRQRYRNERRVELAYEEHRFFDARRWMIAPTTLGRKIGLIRIFGTLREGVQVRTYQYNPENYNYTYTPAELDPGIENRQWLDKMYFMCIHRDEINRNGQLAQNPGYD